MAKLSKHVHEEYTLHLNHGERAWLKAYLQNSHSEDESPEDEATRTILFNALNSSPAPIYA